MDADARRVGRNQRPPRKGEPSSARGPTKIPAKKSSPTRRTTGTIFWVNAILESMELDATKTLLLICLANHVNADDKCWVGIKRLAARSRISYSTAQRHLRTLEEEGYIHRTRRRCKSGNLSVYTYVLQRDAFL